MTKLALAWSGTLFPKSYHLLWYMRLSSHQLTECPWLWLCFSGDSAWVIIKAVCSWRLEWSPNGCFPDSIELTALVGKSQRIRAGVRHSPCLMIGTLFQGTWALAAWQIEGEGRSERGRNGWKESVKERGREQEREQERDRTEKEQRERWKGRWVLC